MATSIKLDNDVFWDGQICETGSNSDGNYIKFANGLLITTKTKSYSGSFTTAFGGNNGTTLNLGNHPIPFTEIWAQLTSPCINSGCVNACCVTGLSNTSAGISQIDRPAGTGAKSGKVYSFTIGRWK